MENHGAWDSALEYVNDMGNLKNIRRELFGSFFKQKLPNFKYKNSQKFYPRYPRDIGKLTIPYLPADQFVANRTHLQNLIERNKRPIQVSSYLVISGWLTVLLLFLVGILVGPFILFACGRNFLRKHPSFFTVGTVSHVGPTRQEVSQASFEMTLIAHGWKGKLESPTEEPNCKPEQLMICRWKGPQAGAIATSTFLVQAAITILKERDAIAYKGGVLTPGLAFQDTTLVERLGRYGILLETIKSF